MAITYNDNSWLRFPGATESSWNDLTNFCNGEKWCYPVDDSLQSKFIVTPGEGSELISNGDFASPVYEGTNTSITVNRLVDNGANFQVSGPTAVIGMTVRNVTDDTTATCTIRPNNTNLALDADIFPAPAGDDYELSGWQEGAGWTAKKSHGYAQASAGSASSLLWAPADLHTDRYYKVTYTISAMTAGSVNADCGGSNGTSRSANGTYTEYIKCGTSNSRFKFDKDAGFDGRIDDVSLIEMEDVLIVLRNCDTEVIAKILEQDPASENTGYTYVNGEILVTVDWSELSLTDGNCYCICVYDATADEAMTNPYFDDLGADWSHITFGVNVSFADNKITLTHTGAPGLAESYESGVLTSGQKYIARVHISAINLATVKVLAGVEVAATAMNTTGVFYWEVVAFGSTKGGVSVVTANGDTTIESVSFINVTDTDRCSECFKYKPSWHSMLKFSFYGDEDQFGFAYGSAGSNLEQQVGLIARVGSETFPEDATTHLDSLGTKKILYGESREVREVTFGEMPRHVHRAMARAWIHDHMTLHEDSDTSAEYTKVPGDWSPAWTDHRNIAPAIIEVEAASQYDNTNTNC